MRTSSSRRVRRGLASFLAAALAAGLTVAGAGAPAQAAATDVTGGTATWNFVDSWTTYVTGPIAQGTVTPPLQGGRSSYGPASGAYDAASGTGSVRLGGSTRYQGHHGALDVTLSDVRLDLTGPGTGVVYADFAGTVNPGAGDDVKVADVAVSATRAGDEVTFVADGTVTASLGDVSPYFSSYAGKPISTLTARVVSPEPAAPAQATTTTLAVSPAGSSVAGASVTLSATVAPAAAGTVEFRDGGAALGTAQVSDGVARLETTTLATGAHELSAAFVPTDPAAFVASTSAGVAHSVTAVQPEPEPEPEPVADPTVTVSPSTPVDPTVENTFTVSGTGFVGDGARYGAYVLVGEKSVWDGSGPLVATGWLQLGWVQPRQVVDGAFTTTLTVPAGKLDPAKKYVVATSAAHGLSATDRSLDTFTPVAVQQPEPQEPVSAPFPQVDEPGTTHGTVSWKVSDRVFSYYDDKQVTGGVTADGTFGFPVTAVEQADGATDLALSGAVRLTWKNTYAGGAPFYWLQLEGLAVRVDETGRGVLSADVSWDNLTDTADSSSASRLDVATFTVDPAGLGTGRVLATSSAQEYTDAFLAYLEPTGQRAHFVASGPNDANAEAKKTAPITLAFGEDAPVREPAIDVYAADGSTPLGGTPVHVGDTIVVKGSGFDPAANVGGRGVPIPATLPQGTYVVFGSFTEQWRPSQGAASSARKVGSQVWALAEPVLDQVPPQFQSAIRAQWTDIAEDGTFEARLVVKNPEALDGGRYGVYTYGAGGVTNADQELFAPVAFDAPAALTVTPAAATVEAGDTVTLTVSGLVEGDSVKGVTFSGKAATYTRDGASIRLTVPSGTAAGPVPVVVTSELGVTGSTTLTVTTPPDVEPPVDPEPAVPTTAGSLSWGVRGSFVDYIRGPIAKGGAVASAGATVSGSSFTFGQSSPWAAPTTGTTTGYRGTVQFTGHDGLLNLTVSSPRVRIDGPRAGTLVLDVASSNLDGTTFRAKDVAFATLALGTPATGADGAVTYTDAAATLTADGSLAFSGFYPAGTDLAPLSFTVGATATGPGGGGTIGTPGGGSTGATTDPAKATLSVSQARPGDEVTISGIGFGAHEAGIRTEIRSTPRTLATGVTANAGGAASSTVTIPEDVAPGEHTLLLVGAGHTASAPITIVGAGTTGTATGSGGAAEQCFAQGVNGATLSWGVSDRFRAYVTGPIAKGSVSTDGARDTGSAFAWGGGKGSFNTDLGKGRASFGGSVSFSGHEGILDLRISNPRVVVNGSTGTLVVDVRSSDMEGTTSSSNGVAFASLDLSGTKSTSGSTITWTGAPATLTAAGAKAFAGFYEAGTALSPVTFAFPVGGDVECDAYSGALASTGSDAGGLALLAGSLLLTGAALVTVRRRRAGRVEVAAAA